MVPIGIDTAFSHILRESAATAVARVPLNDALGCVLAEDVCADRDWPPFNRSTVDGYAVFSADTRSAPDVLEVIEEVPAGKSAARALSPGQAIRIMTGAPVPAGADSVIMQERTEIPREGYVRVLMTLRPGQNIARRAEDAGAGAVVIQSGALIGAAEIGVLASVGCHDVPVRKKPVVAILGSGDELVEPWCSPGPAQIRNSNSYQLLAQCHARGLETRYLGIAPDERAATLKKVEEGLNADVLVATGGVSVGAHDHVGASMKELGVQIIFDKVSVKPGKPTTFGKRGQTLVFGLPGNPVAAFVCFYLFVMTAIRKRMGAREPLPRWFTLPLHGNLKGSEDRTTFRPAKIRIDGRQTFAEAIEWHGSGHLAALVGADGLIAQSPNQGIASGESVTFYPF